MFQHQAQSQVVLMDWFEMESNAVGVTETSKYAKYTQPT